MATYGWADRKLTTTLGEAGTEQSESATAPTVSAQPQPAATATPKPRIDNTNPYALIDPRTLTLHDLFLRDFQGTQKSVTAASVKRPNGVVSVETCVATNLELGTKLIEFYIPTTEDTYGVCVSLADAIQPVLANDAEVLMTQQIPGDSDVSTSTQSRFTGSVFVYYDGSLTAEQRGSLTRLYNKKRLRVQFRGADYLANRKLQAQVDNKS